METTIWYYLSRNVITMDFCFKMICIICEYNIMKAYIFCFNVCRPCLNIPIFMGACGQLLIYKMCIQTNLIGKTACC